LLTAKPRADAGRAAAATEGLGTDSPGRMEGKMLSKTFRGNVMQNKQAVFRKVIQKC
jgi:hypothetical protein